MKTRTSAKVVLSAAIVMGWTWLTALQCGDAIGPIQGCSVFYDGDFPAGGSIFLNKPANCPVSLLGTTFVPYAATAEFTAGTVLYGFYHNEIVTWNGQHRSFVAYPVWSQGNGKYFVNITGDYVAASGGFDSNDTGYDDIRNGFSKGSTWTYATTRLTYKFGLATNTVYAPNTVGLNETYLVQATTNDPLIVSPVSWSWYVEGQLMGTTSQNRINLQSGTHSGMIEVKVLASDGNGHSVWGQKVITIGAGCQPGVPC